MKDISGNNRQRLPLEGAAIGQCPGQDGLHSRQELTALWICQITCASQRDNLEQADDDADNENGNRHIECSTSGPQEKIHRFIHDVFSRSSTVTCSVSLFGFRFGLAIDCGCRRTETQSGRCGITGGTGDIAHRNRERVIEAAGIPEIGF